jgi:hypothetical protein
MWDWKLIDHRIEEGGDQADLGSRLYEPGSYGRRFAIDKDQWNGCLLYWSCSFRSNCRLGLFSEIDARAAIVIDGCREGDARYHRPLGNEARFVRCFPPWSLDRIGNNLESGFHRGSVQFVVRNTNELPNQEDGNENL